MHMMAETVERDGTQQRFCQQVSPSGVEPFSPVLNLNPPLSQVVLQLVPPPAWRQVRLPRLLTHNHALLSTAAVRPLP